MGIILSAIFVPACIAIIFSVLPGPNNQKIRSKNKNTFTISLPKIVSVIGAMCAITFAIAIISFSVFSEEKPHIIYYFVFGGFLWVGIYLILKTTKWKVVVDKEKITVYPIFLKPYMFELSDIVKVKRQVKNNINKSERLLVYTSNNRRLVVESLEISYFDFLQLIEKNVDINVLHGFKHKGKTGDGSLS